MNLRKMNKGTGRGAGIFFAISGFHLDATRFNLPYQPGIRDDSDYDVLTEITSYKRELCRLSRKPWNSDLKELLTVASNSSCKNPLAGKLKHNSL